MTIRQVLDYSRRVQPMSHATTPSGPTPTPLPYDRQQGFLILRGLLSEEEMRAVVAEADRLCVRADLIHSDNLRCRWQPHVETSECLFETFDPVIDLSPFCAALA